MLAELLATYTPAIDAELRATLGFQLPPPDDYARMMYYHLGWIDEDQPQLVAGKRTRPIITLLVAAAAAGDWQAALPFAAAVELIHNFSLVHDDIQDDSDLRRGRATVWKLWGRAQAINSGDALFAFAHLALQRAAGLPAGEVLRALRILDQTCIHLTTGQHYDMGFETRQSVSVDEYLSMIEGKTASLIATAAEFGALAAQASPAIQDQYREYGRHLGLAFQIRDDVLGIWGDPAVTGKSTATDILTRKKTLPVLFGLQNDPTLVADYRPEASGGAPVDHIIAKLQACGARSYAEHKEQQHVNQALDSLAAAAPSGDAGQALRALTLQLLGRAN